MPNRVHLILVPSDDSGSMEPDTELEAALTQGQSIGRPLMNDQELLALEQRLARPIRPGKRGRPASTEP